MKFIKIIKCKYDQKCWYYNKIGQVFVVDETCVFPRQYTIRISNEKDKTSYAFIDKDDVEIIHPSFWDKLKHFFNIKRY